MNTENSTFLRAAWLMLTRKLTTTIAMLLSSVVTMTLSAQLVSNLDEGSAGEISVDNTGTIAGQFTTGSNSGGYTLTSATGKFSTAFNSPTTFQARIFSDDSDEPGSSLETLGVAVNPTTSGNHTFTSSGLQLNANTSYWLVFSSTEAAYRWFNTTSDNETSSDGWTIGNTTTFSTNQEASWDGSINRAAQFSIQATPVPEPHEYAMFVGLGLVGFVVARRRLCSKTLA